MQATLRLLPLLLLALALSGLAHAQEAVPFKLSKEAREAAAANNAFAYDLYRQLASQESGNTFFSPFSIESALAMTAVGARGDTVSEMADVLHAPQSDFHAGLGELTRSLVGDLLPIPGPAPEQAPLNPRNGLDDSLQPAVNPFHPPQPIKPAVNPFGPPIDPPAPEVPNHLIRIANRLWPQVGFEFKTPFLDTVTSHYGAGVQELDYRADPELAKNTINGWVEEQTKDADGKPMIKDLIKELSSATRMVLTNAIYFKGDWASQFDRDDTQEDGTFSKLDGSLVDDTPLMNQTQRFGYADVPDVGQILELPYKAKALSMFVFLPARGEAAFKDFESKLDAETVSGWLERVYTRKVQVVLPRFELESSFELGSTLQAMGMKSAFDPATADFRDMASRTLPDGSEGNVLSVSEVVHKAVARVDEEGSEMAAATAVIVVESTSTPLPPPVFRADRPFVFMVRDNASGAVLFMGRMLDPKN